MSFNWLDFLKLAEVLNGTPDDAPLSEAAFRSATSRSYYAAFHNAKDQARYEGFFFSDQGDDHQNVQRYFRNSEEAIRTEIAAKLSRLLVNRNKADYDDPLYSSPRALADMSVKTAQKVIILINSLPQT